jgi:hypothetical protein
MDSSSLHCSTPMPAATASSRSRSSRRRPAGPCCRCCAPASGHRARKSSKSCVTSSVASVAIGPAVEIMVRGDSHFATPEVMNLMEEKYCSYIFGLSTNPRLTEIGRPWSEDVATGRALSKTQKMRRFFQTSYAAASWSKPRKVVARVEASEQGSDIRFIVTNLPGRAQSRVTEPRNSLTAEVLAVGSAGTASTKPSRRRGIVGSAGVARAGKGTGWIASKPGRSRSRPRASNPADRVAG